LPERECLRIFTRPDLTMRNHWAGSPSTNTYSRRRWLSPFRLVLSARMRRQSAPCPAYGSAGGRAEEVPRPGPTETRLHNRNTLEVRVQDPPGPSSASSDINRDPVVHHELEQLLQGWLPVGLHMPL
jgi:hypothetical protein